MKTFAEAYTTTLYSSKVRKPSEKLRTRRNTLLCVLTILEICRDQGIFPSCVKLAFKKKNEKIRNIPRTASLALLTKSIRNRRNLNHIYNQLFKLLLEYQQPITWKRPGISEAKKVRWMKKRNNN